jgi:hypothetical protein
LATSGAQFLHFIVVWSETDGAVGLIVSFCPRSPGIVWIRFFCGSKICERQTEMCD